MLLQNAVAGVCGTVCCRRIGLTSSSIPGGDLGRAGSSSRRISSFRAASMALVAAQPCTARRGCFHTSGARLLTCRWSPRADRVLRGPMSFHCPHEPREACSRFCCRGGGPCIGHSSVRFPSQATGFDPAPLPRCRAPGPPAACFQGSAAIPNPPTRRRAGVPGWAQEGHPIPPRLPAGRLQVVFLLITSFAWSTVLSEVLGP